MVHINSLLNVLETVKQRSFKVKRETDSAHLYSGSFHLLLQFMLKFVVGYIRRCQSLPNLGLYELTKDHLEIGDLLLQLQGIPTDLDAEFYDLYYWR